MLYEYERLFVSSTVREPRLWESDTDRVCVPLCDMDTVLDCEKDPVDSRLREPYVAEKDEDCSLENVLEAEEDPIDLLPSVEDD